MFRKEPEQRSVAFYDLDKIHSETVTFRLHGKLFKIAPLSTLEFFTYTQEYNKFQALSAQKKITPEELAEGFFRVFSAVCPEMTQADVQSCSQQQAAVIFGMILDTVTGKDDVDKLKKKTFNLPTMRLTG